MNPAQATQETLNALKAAHGNPDLELMKAWTQSANPVAGLTAYDLEGPAKTLYPVLSPLRNMIPRVPAKGGIQANWRAVTGINVAGLSAGVSQGNRGGIIATTLKEYMAAYRGIGLEDYVTFEADYAAGTFDDVKARAVEGLLRAFMIQEERIILGGNSAAGLGTTATPIVTTATTGGSIPNSTTVSVICVALTLEGFLNGSVAGGIPAQVSRTNADGTVDIYGGGSARKSAAASVATGGAGGTHVVNATVTYPRGAVAFAWFWGAAGAETLGAITGINSVQITVAAGTGTQTAASMPASDQSVNAFVFEGLIPQLAEPTSGAYYKALPTGVAGTGTPLTNDNAGGIVEIDDALASFWEVSRLTPTAIWVSAREMNNITKKVLANPGGTGAIRYVADMGRNMTGGGVAVTSYLNRYGMGAAREIPINLHPYMPPGTIMFTSNEPPYPLSNIGNVLQIRERRSYYQIEWPLRTRKYEYGIYADEVLQNYFPPSMGLIQNVGNG